MRHGGEMRLVCPNCGAQYEVPDEVVPESGRDVQCSSCGDTWFQQHPKQIAAAEAEAESAAEQAGFAEDLPEPETAPEPEQADWPSDPQQDARAQDDGDVEDGGEIDDNEDTLPDYGLSDETAQGRGEDEDEDAPFIEITDTPAPAEASAAQQDDWTPPAQDQAKASADDEYYEDETGADELTSDGAGLDDAPAPPQRRPLDAGVAELLREEAEREARARAAESNSDFESQGDLGLDEPSVEDTRREREAQIRMARLRGEPEPAPETAATLAAMGGSRRDLLPDIEEINSTLRSTRDRRPASAGDQDGAMDEAPQKRSFRSGFGAAVLIAVVLLVIYVNAAKISSAVPAIAPAVDGYAAQVDRARGWLDAKMVSMMTKMDDMAGAPNTAAPQAPAASE